MSNISVKTYFDDKSSSYDNQIKKPFWYFCDELIWEKLYEELLSMNKKKFSVIDLGGGTGAWAQKIKTHFPQAAITIVDQSESMLSIAKENLSEYDDIKFIKGDILEQNMTETFDVCLCIYVSMFIKKQSELFQQLSKNCHRDSKIIFVGQNINHTVSMLVSNNQVEEAVKLLKLGHAKITDHHPILYFLSRDDIISLSQKYNLKIDNLGSFPKFCRVGVREKITSFNYSISDVLRKKANFDLLKGLEYNKLWEDNLDVGMYWILCARKGE